MFQKVNTETMAFARAFFICMIAMFATSSKILNAQMRLSTIKSRQSYCGCAIVLGVFENRKYAVNRLLEHYYHTFENH